MQFSCTTNNLPLTINPQYVFLQPKTNSSSNSSSSPTHLLSLLPTDPPNPHLAVGSTSEVPPTPRSVTENPHFFTLLQSVIAEHAIHDPAVQSQALAFASQGGATLGSGGMFFPQQRAQRQRGQGRTAATFTGGGGGAGGGGAGGASAQGGMGGGGKAGFVHVSDQRNPPDWGRVAYPEDIFGSLQLDAEGKFVGKGGSYQSSGTYRLCTGDGM